MKESDYDIFFFTNERYSDPTACCTHYDTSWIDAAIWYQDGKWMSTYVADYYRQLVSAMRDDNKVEREHSTECE